MRITLRITFTESPSLNVEVLHDGVRIFYNSERLQGNDATRNLAKILNITSAPCGDYEFDITKEQYNSICNLYTESMSKCYKPIEKTNKGV
jgi:hypothetical protein